MINLTMNPCGFQHLQIEEDLTELKADMILDALFNRERAKNIKANTIAPEIASAALLA